MVKSFDLRKATYKLGSFLIALSLVLDCRSMWTSTHDNNFTNMVFASLVIGGTLYIISSTKKHIRINLDFFLIISFILIYLLIYFLLPENIIYIKTVFRYYLSFTILLFCSILSYKSNDLPSFVRIYINIIVIIGIVSLFFWTFGSMLKIIRPDRTIFSYWSTPLGVSCPSYYNIYFETQLINGIIIRNTAIFTEAPMASLNFTIALLFQNLFNTGDRYHNFKQVILIICILSTFSSTGYIALLLLFVLKALLTNYKHKNIILPFICFFTIIAVVLVHFILNTKLSSDSGQTRMDDFKAGFQAWKVHPIMGSGLNSTAYTQFMSNWRSFNLGLSSTIMDILCSGGIYVLALYLGIIAFSGIRSIRLKNSSNLIYTILILYLFITTIFSNTYILYFIFDFMAINSIEKYDFARISTL